MIAQKISPFLWFSDAAEHAANFYVSVFGENSSVDSLHHNVDGSVLVVNFTLRGQDFIALNGGPMFKLTEAVSFVIHCDGQEEVDYFWSRLSEGGEEQMCGWLKDRFGLSWQVIPIQFNQMMSAANPARAGAIMGAMLEMRKFDIAGLERARDAASS